MPVWGVKACVKVEQTCHGEFEPNGVAEIASGTRLLSDALPDMSLIL
jgi:hypothetical protein